MGAASSAARGLRRSDDWVRGRPGVPPGGGVWVRFADHRGHGLLQRLGLGLGLPHRCPFQFDTVRIVEEAIADGVGLVRVANDAVPVGDRELAGDQDGGPGPALPSREDCAGATIGSGAGLEYPLAAACGCGSPIIGTPSTSWVGSWFAASMPLSVRYGAHCGGGDRRWRRPGSGRQ